MINYVATAELRNIYPKVTVVVLIVHGGLFLLDLALNSDGQLQMQVHHGYIPCHFNSVKGLEYAL